MGDVRPPYGPHRDGAPIVSHRDGERWGVLPPLMGGVMSGADSRYLRGLPQLSLTPVLVSSTLAIVLPPFGGFSQCYCTTVG